MKQEMTTRWQRHQVDHMQIICISLQTDNHASTSSLNSLQARRSSWHTTNSVKALKAYHSYISKLVQDRSSTKKYTRIHKKKSMS